MECLIQYKEKSISFKNTTFWPTVPASLCCRLISMKWISASQLPAFTFCRPKPSHLIMSLNDAGQGFHEGKVEGKTKKKLWLFFRTWRRDSTEGGGSRSWNSDSIPVISGPSRCEPWDHAGDFDDVCVHGIEQEISRNNVPAGAGLGFNPTCQHEETQQSIELS